MKYADQRKMLTDSPKLKSNKSPKARKDKTTRWYSDSQKLEAVKLWLLTGNLVHTAAALNLSFTTVRNWRYSDWWEDLVTELKSQEQIELSNKLKRISQKSLDELEDRLANGDWVLDRKTGKLVRKPASLRDTTQTFNSLHDRTQRLETKPKDENKQVLDRLSALAAQFEQIANKRQPIKVTDVIYAIHDERKEGLQEGIELGEETQTPPSQGQSSPEQREITVGA